MVQLGPTIHRLIHMLACNYHPRHPLKFVKLDIKFGSWRMTVSNDDAWNYCYVLLPLNKTVSMDDIKIVVLNSLQMKWCESLPFFCSVS